MTAACPGCDAELTNPLQRYCGPACADRHSDRIIAEAMVVAKPQRPPPPPRARDVGGKRWCAWCGNDLPRGSKGRFCGADCGDEYFADIQASTMPRHAA